MGIRREILQVVFGALGFSAALAMGYIKPDNPFITNVTWSVALMIISRMLAWLFGGKGK